MAFVDFVGTFSVTAESHKRKLLRFHSARVNLTNTQWLPNLFKAQHPGHSSNPVLGGVVPGTAHVRNMRGNRRNIDYLPVA